MVSSPEPLILVWPALARLPRHMAALERGLERFTTPGEYGEGAALRSRIDL